MWMCRWFFKDASKIQNDRQKSTPKFFVGAETLHQKSFKFHNHIAQQYGDVQVIF